MTGIPAADAVSRPCYTLLRGHDHGGRMICRANCALIEAIRGGQPVASRTLEVDTAAGGAQRFRCELSTLPFVPGGAVGRLAAMDSAEHHADAEPPASPVTRQVNIIEDFAVLSTLATTLPEADSPQGIERALDALRYTTAAESAELFLAEPTGHDMLLTAYRGPFRSAFTEIVRFAPGEGFPGLVMSSQQAVTTNTLARDSRHRRSRVRDRGYQVSLCVPLRAGDEIIGTVCVSSRNATLSLGRTEQVLTWASTPLANALQAGLLQTRRRAAREALVDSQTTTQSHDAILQRILEHAVELGQADSGQLVLFNDTTPNGGSCATAGITADFSCPALVQGGRCGTCPALADGHGIVLAGARTAWPLACQQARVDGRMTTCLPLRVNDEAIGLIQLHSRQTVPAPPTHHVRQLLEAIDEVAPLIRLSREHAHPTTPVADAQYDVPARRSTPVSQNPNTPPLLQFHCFGHFELLRAGTIITPHMFKRRKALTLLKMLLLHAEQPLHKETLIEWLWPGSDPEAGANRLYVVVHALRAMLQPADANDAAAVIHTRADHYVFEPGTASSLDLTDFQVAVDTGRRAEERNDPSTALAAYTAAENVYRGDLFADEPFAEWCVLEREQLREVYLDVLQRHARLAHDVGDLTRAIDVYRRVVQMEPLREEVQRRLIACLWSARRRDEALHQYDLLRECLLRELDISPLPETEELVARIRNDH